MKKLAITIILLTIVSGQLSAQRYAAQDGHLLDANNRVGSMGWNGNARMDALSYRNDSMMTGNLTGGMSFQGQMSYSSTRSFQGLSRSDTLGNFRRDSRSVSSLGVSGPRVYVDQSRSLTGSYGGGISRSYQGYSTSSIINPRQSTGYSQQYSSSLSYKPGAARSDFSLNRYINQNTDNQNMLGRSSGPAGIASEALGRTGMGFSMSTMDNRLTFSRDRLQQPEQPEIEVKEHTQLNIQIDDQQQTEARGADAEKPVDIEEQMYLDPEKSQRIFNEGEKPGTKIAASDEISNQLQDKYKGYISQGKEYLKSGEYYRAIDSFELSKVFSSRNSQEPLFNCMIARFAAGEYVSATSNLYRMFHISLDKTLEKRDIVGMFGGQSEFDECMQDINMVYDATKNRSLLFLKAYIEYMNNELDKSIMSFTDLHRDNPNIELFEQILIALQTQREELGLRP